MQKTFNDPQAFHVLVIEDDLDHAELIRRTLQGHHSDHEILHLEDGAQAKDFLAQIVPDDENKGTKPDVILLDIRLPKMNGHEVLAIVKDNPALRSIPVIILTTSSAPDDLKKAYLGHANSYLVKPPNFDSFSALVELIGTYWLDWNKQMLSAPS